MSEVPFTYLMCGIEYNTDGKTGSGYRIGYDFGADVGVLHGDSIIYESHTRLYFTIPGEIVPRPKAHYRNYYAQCG